MKATHDVKPVLMEQSGRGYVVRWDLAQTTIDTEDGMQEVWECEEVYSPTRKYDDVVSAIVHSIYSLDAEVAIINNHLLGEKEDEWIAYQGWRVFAKHYAGQVLGLKNENNEDDEDEVDPEGEEVK